MACLNISLRLRLKQRNLSISFSFLQSHLKRTPHSSHALPFRALLLSARACPRPLTQGSAGDGLLSCMAPIPIPKKGNDQKCSNYRTIALISHASKVMLKILQARLQEYMNRELPDVQAGFRKGRGTRDQIANICWIMEKAREFQKNIYFCFTDYAKSFDCVDPNKLWKILKEMGIPDHLTCLLRNLFAGKEAS